MYSATPGLIEGQSLSKLDEIWQRLTRMNEKNSERQIRKLFNIIFSTI